jgi:hypothetical protein
MNKNYALIMACLLLGNVFALSIFVDEPELLGKFNTDPKAISTLVELSLEKAGVAVTLQKDKADFILKTKIIKLEENLLVVMSKYHQDKLINSAENKVKNMDEADVAINQLVQAVLQQTQAVDQVAIGEVTQRQENFLETRIKSQWYTGAGFGPSKLLNLGSDYLSYNLVFAGHREVADHVMIKTRFDTNWDFYPFGSDKKAEFNFLLSWVFGANYCILKKNHSPFLGGEFGYGVSKNDASRFDGGFVFGLSLGYVFFRVVSTQVLVEANGQVMLTRTDGPPPSKIGLTFSAFHTRGK